MKKLDKFSVKPQEPQSGLAAKVLGNQPKQLPHVVLKAYAGTGKTTTLIVGTAWAFAYKLWPQIQRTMSEKINEKHRLEWEKDPKRPYEPKIDPDTFKFIPSAEQQAVWDQLRLSAEAGAKSITYGAFNKAIVQEFGEQWGWMVDLLRTQDIQLQFSTVNALGNRAVTAAFGRVKCVTWHTDNLISEYLETDIRDVRKEPGGVTLVSATKELVGLCKLTMTGWNGDKLSPPSEDELDKLVRHYEIELDGCRYKYLDGSCIEEQVYDLVPEILRLSMNVQGHGEIDFDDQNWLPVVLGLPIPKSDLVLIDEAQDLPRAKQEYLLKAGRRIVVVGDTNQACYGFAGAAVDSIPRMEKMLNVTEPLLLTETRRCGKAIVAEANQTVPDFKAHESNGAGKVSSAYYSEKDNNGRTVMIGGKPRETYHSLVDDKDMVLCRLNAPLVSQALKMLAMGRKVVIRGRDFGGQLIAFIKKLNATDVENLLDKAREWVDIESAKERRKKNPSDSKIAGFEDRFNALKSFCKDASQVEDVVAKIDLVFAGKHCPRCRKHFSEDVDTCPEKLCKVLKDASGWPIGPKLQKPDGILFSSIHRAKGLEANRVFFLMPKGAECPLTYPKLPWQIQQERNLLYIGQTRAIDELVYVR